MKPTISNFVKITLACLLSCLVYHADAQEREIAVVRDIESWMEVGAEFEISKKFDIAVFQSARLRHNSSKLDQFYTEIELTYNPVKKLNIGGGFRFISSKKNDRLEPKLRLISFISFKQDIERFSIKYRFKYQNDNELGKSKDEGDFFTHQFRLQTVFEYNIRKWKVDPKLSFELFNRLEEGDFSLNRLRLKLGSDYKFKKAGSLKFFFSYERSLMVDNPKNVSIVGLGYTFKVKRKDKVEE